MRKKTIFFLLAAIFCFISTVEAKTLYNYKRLYRGERSLGMGGTGVAVGGDKEAAFHNPAALYNLGVDVSFPDIQKDQSNSFSDICGSSDLFASSCSNVTDALDKSSDVERISALTEIVNANIGTPMHLGVSGFAGVGIKSFLIGGFGIASSDVRFHNPLSSEGAFETNIDVGGGAIIGGSFAIKAVDGLRIGAAAKYLNMAVSVRHGFTIPELANTDNFDIDDYNDNESDYSFDLGVLYELKKGGFLSKLKPQFALSVLDITELKYNTYERIPTTLNIGFSLNPALPIVDLVFALDYKDVTKALPEDQSTWKRLHMGAELAIWKRFALRIGLNQGYPTFGFNVDLWVVKMSYTYYSEEMGAYAGQDKDTRQMIKFHLGW